MSDFSENKRTQIIIDKLGCLRQKVDALSVLAPGWMELDELSAMTPVENKEKFIELLGVVFLIADIWINLPVHMPPMISEKDKPIFDWYNREFSVVRKKGCNLLLQELAPGMKTLCSKVGGHKSRPNNPFETIIVKFLRVISRSGGQLFDELTNLRVVRPIVIERDLKGIPSHVHDRVAAIHHAIVVHNWLAAIAMSRCLLESALVDKWDDFHSEVLGESKQKDGMKLVDRICIAAKVHRDLKESMTFIRKVGNGVMHPNQKRIEQISPGKETAEKCFESIRKIFSVLYRE